MGILHIGFEEFPPELGDVVATMPLQSFSVFSRKDTRDDQVPQVIRDGMHEARPGRWVVTKDAGASDLLP